MTEQQVAPVVPAQGRGFRAYTAKHLDRLLTRARLSEADRLAARAVATVLPFRTNEYVVEHLIDWESAPDDPIYRLVFPQADMLPAEDIGPLAGISSRRACPTARFRPRRAWSECASTRTQRDNSR